MESAGFPLVCLYIIDMMHVKAQVRKGTCSLRFLFCVNMFPGLGFGLTFPVLHDKIPSFDAGV